MWNVEREHRRRQRLVRVVGAFPSHRQVPGHVAGYPEAEAAVPVPDASVASQIREVLEAGERFREGDLVVVVHIERVPDALGHLRTAQLLAHQLHLPAVDGAGVVRVNTRKDGPLAGMQGFELLDASLGKAGRRGCCDEVTFAFAAAVAIGSLKGTEVPRSGSASDCDRRKMCYGRCRR